jgi:hypothetical protein
LRPFERDLGLPPKEEKIKFDRNMHFAALCCFRMESHEGQLFQDNCVVYSIVGISSPSKGSVGANEDGRDIIRGLSLKSLDDDISGFFFVFASDFICDHFLGAGNLPAEVIAMGRTVGGDAAACLSPTGCPAEMGHLYAGLFSVNPLLGVALGAITFVGLPLAATNGS